MANNLTIAQKKEWAKLLFIKENLTQKEIAERVGVSVQTINKWVNAGGWELLKASITITKQEQLSRIYMQIAALNKKIAEEQKGIPSVVDADILSKLAATIERLEKETSITDVVSVSIRFLDWLRAADNNKAKDMSALFDGFIKDLLKQNG